DAKGSEKLALHAQKDMHTTVKNAQSLVVEAGDRTLTLQTGNEFKKLDQGSLSEDICMTRSTKANTIQVKAEAGKGGEGTQLYEAQDDISLKVGSGTIQMTKTNIKISFGSSSIELSDSGITVLGGQINLNK
ncbi:type VI secretion system tip protein VgrG, partial [Xenorhabdus sp. XENO-2]|nr:type VI secretion system tip protein VgrG [Xenorhabdus anantnagensis]